MNIRTFILILFCSITLLVWPKQSFYAQTGLTKVEGLSQGMVMCLLQDRDGFIWVGTLDGLNRYDGYGFKTFYHNPDDSNSIAGNTIHNLFEDSKGRLWISLGKDGLDCYDKTNGKFLHISKKYPDLICNLPQYFQLCEANNGKIYVLSPNSIHEITVEETHLRSKINEWGFECKNLFINPQGENQDKFNQLFAYQEKTLAIVQNDKVRLFSLSTHSWLPTNLIDNIENHWMNAIFWDSALHSFWYIQNDHLYANKNGRNVYQAPFVFNSLAHDFSHFNKGHDGSMYISVPSVGVIKVALEASTFQAPRLFEAEPLQNSLTQFMIDKQGRLWLGTNGYGLYSTMPKNNDIVKIKCGSTYYIHAIDTILMAMNSDKLMSLHSDNLQPLSYKSTENDLVQLKKLPNGNSVSVQGKQGNYIIGIISNEGKPIKSFPFNNRYNPIDLQVLVDTWGQVWLSFQDGKIARINRGMDSLQMLDFAKGCLRTPIGNETMCLYQSIDSVIWMATNQGLIRIENPNAFQPRFHLYQNKPNDDNSISNNNILSVMDDPAQPKRFIWLATRGGGLNKMDKQTGQCTRYNVEQGLPNKVVYGVLSDSLGRIWVSTNNGISCFDPKKQYFHNFTLADGLQDNEFNTHSFYKHPDGRLFFGGVKGINIIKPDQITFDSTFYPVFFTSLKINNKTISPRDGSGILESTIEQTKEINLPYNQNFLTLDFAATDFSKLGCSNYRYQLEGLDEGWNFATTQNEASYPNLAPGDYTFRVSNSNQNGDWNPSEATLIVHISPPWWKSITAYCCYLLSFAIVFVLLVNNWTNRFRLMENVRLKEKEALQLKEIEEIKSRFFNNVTHELRTPLTMVIEPARQLLSEDTNKGNPKMMAIHDNAVRLLHLVGDLLDISKLEAKKMRTHLAHGDIIPLLQSLLDTFQGKASQKSIQLTFNPCQEALIVNTDKGMVEKMAANLLSNAIKFTDKGGSIAFNITTIDNTHWKISVSDTGIGIDQKDQPFIFDRYYQANSHPTRRSEGTGIGLSLVKEYALLLQGNVGVESQIGKGSTIWVSLPKFPQNYNEPQSTSVQDDGFQTTIPKLQPTHFAEEEFTIHSEAANVLIVEDNTEMAQFIAKMVVENGYNAFLAQDGAKGYDKALETIPDIILSDWMMPNRDGLEMAQQLKANIITCHIPIVLLTAKASVESKIEGYSKGADAYLSKPFNKKELLVRMKQLLEARRLVQMKFNPQISGTVPSKKGLPHTENKTEKTQDDLFMEKINAYIEENISNANLTIDTLTTEVHMSRSQLIRKLTALTGETPGKYIRGLKLNHAQALLKSNPSKTLKEVMVKVGYNDIHYFTFQYKERFGEAPENVL